MYCFKRALIYIKRCQCVMCKTKTTAKNNNNSSVRRGYESADSFASENGKSVSRGGGRSPKILAFHARIFGDRPPGANCVWAAVLAGGQCKRSGGAEVDCLGGQQNKWQFRYTDLVHHQTLLFLQPEIGGRECCQQAIQPRPGTSQKRPAASGGGRWSRDYNS